MAATMQHKQQIMLSPGGEVVLLGSGAVALELASGVLEVSGVVLEAGQTYTFYLAPPAVPSMVCYTLEGGSLSLRSESPVRAFQGAAGAGELHQLARRPTTDHFRVLVLGRPGVGKTHAAHTLCNLLYRVAKESGAAPRRTFLVDLNTASNALYAPGCVSSRDVSGSTLWLGQTAPPSHTGLTLNFFGGTAKRPSNMEEGLALLYMAKQCVDTTALWVEELQPQQPRRYTMVLDAPSPTGDLKALTFYKQLVQVVRPTHVVLVTDEVKPGSWELDEEESGESDRDGEEEEKPSDEEQEEVRRAAQQADATSFSPRWAQSLMEDVRRSMPDCAFVRMRPVLQTEGSYRSPAAVVPHLLQQYFAGAPSFPLGCSKVVLPPSALQFVELRYDPDAQAVMAHPSAPPQCSWRHLLCSVSHAEMLEEVPLAPTAGLLLIVHVDEEMDEMILIIPASATEPLRRRFIVLPSMVAADTSEEESGGQQGLDRAAAAGLQRDPQLHLSEANATRLEEAAKNNKKMSRVDLHWLAQPTTLRDEQVECSAPASRPDLPLHLFLHDYTYYTHHCRPPNPKPTHAYRRFPHNLGGFLVFLVLVIPAALRSAPVPMFLLSSLKARISTLGWRDYARLVEIVISLAVVTAMGILSYEVISLYICAIMVALFTFCHCFRLWRAFDSEREYAQQQSFKRADRILERLCQGLPAVPPAPVTAVNEEDHTDSAASPLLPAAAPGDFRPGPEAPPMTAAAAESPQAAPASIYVGPAPSAVPHALASTLPGAGEAESHPAPPVEDPAPAALAAPGVPGTVPSAPAATVPALFASGQSWALSEWEPRRSRGDPGLSLRSRVAACRRRRSTSRQTRMRRPCRARDGEWRARTAVVKRRPLFYAFFLSFFFVFVEIETRVPQSRCLSPRPTLPSTAGEPPKTGTTFTLPLTAHHGAALRCTRDLCDRAAPTLHTHPCFTPASTLLGGFLVFLVLVIPAALRSAPVPMFLLSSLKARISTLGWRDYARLVEIVISLAVVTAMGILSYEVISLYICAVMVALFTFCHCFRLWRAFDSEREYAQQQSFKRADRILERLCQGLPAVPPAPVTAVNEEDHTDSAASPLLPAAAPGDFRPGPEAPPMTAAAAESPQAAPASIYVGPAPSAVPHALASTLPGSGEERAEAGEAESHPAPPVEDPAPAALAAPGVPGTVPSAPAATVPALFASGQSWALSEWEPRGESGVTPGLSLRSRGGCVSTTSIHFEADADEETWRARTAVVKRRPLFYAFFLFFCVCGDRDAGSSVPLSFPTTYATFYCWTGTTFTLPLTAHHGAALRCTRDLCDRAAPTLHTHPCFTPASTLLGGFLVFLVLVIPAALRSAPVPMFLLSSLKARISTLGWRDYARLVEIVISLAVVTAMGILSYEVISLYICAVMVALFTFCHCFRLWRAFDSERDGPHPGASVPGLPAVPPAPVTAVNEEDHTDSAASPLLPAAAPGDFRPGPEAPPVTAAAAESPQAAPASIYVGPAPSAVPHALASTLPGAGEAESHPAPPVEDPAPAALAAPGVPGTVPSAPAATVPALFASGQSWALSEWEPRGSRGDPGLSLRRDRAAPVMWGVACPHGGCEAPPPVLLFLSFFFFVFVEIETRVPQSRCLSPRPTLPSTAGYAQALLCFPPFFFLRHSPSSEERKPPKTGTTFTLPLTAHQGAALRCTRDLCDRAASTLHTHPCFTPASPLLGGFLVFLVLVIPAALRSAPVPMFLLSSLKARISTLGWRDYARLVEIVISLAVVTAMGILSYEVISLYICAVMVALFTFCHCFRLWRAFDSEREYAQQQSFKRADRILERLCQGLPAVPPAPVTAVNEEDHTDSAASPLLPAAAPGDFRPGPEAPPVTAAAAESPQAAPASIYVGPAPSAVPHALASTLPGSGEERAEAGEAESHPAPPVEDPAPAALAAPGVPGTVPSAPAATVPALFASGQSWALSEWEPRGESGVTPGLSLRSRGGCVSTTSIHFEADADEETVPRPAAPCFTLSFFLFFVFVEIETRVPQSRCLSPRPTLPSTAGYAQALLCFPPFFLRRSPSSEERKPPKTGTTFTLPLTAHQGAALRCTRDLCDRAAPTLHTHPCFTPASPLSALSLSPPSLSLYINIYQSWWLSSLFGFSYSRCTTLRAGPHVSPLLSEGPHLDAGVARLRPAGGDRHIAGGGDGHGDLVLRGHLLYICAVMVALFTFCHCFRLWRAFDSEREYAQQQSFKRADRILERLCQGLPAVPPAPVTAVNEEDHTDSAASPLLPAAAPGDFRPGPEAPPMTAAAAESPQAAPASIYVGPAPSAVPHALASTLPGSGEERAEAGEAESHPAPPVEDPALLLLLPLVSPALCPLGLIGVGAARESGVTPGLSLRSRGGCVSTTSIHFEADADEETVPRP
eukprot:gene8158-5687_t